MESLKRFFSNKIVVIMIRLCAAIAGIGTLAIATNMYRIYVFTGEKSLRYNMFVGISLVCIFVAMGYFLWLILKKKTFSYERLFLVLAICWGIAMQIVMPPFSGPDECTHFRAAYNASNMYMLKGMDLNHMVMRQGDLKLWEYDVRFPDSYQLIADGEWFGMDAEGKKLIVSEDSWVYWLRYLVSGLGILIARIFNLGFEGLMYAGRFANTIFMILVGYYCVKKAPYGKAQVVSLTMLPLLMELCNSYSYDNNSVLLSLLFGVMCLQFSQEGYSFKLSDVCILAITMILLYPNKSVYVMFIILLFMIPQKSWKQLSLGYEKGTQEYKKQKRKFIILFSLEVILLVVMAYHYGEMIFGQIVKDPGETIETIGTYEAFSIPYMIHNPGETFGLVFRTIRLYGWQDFKSVMGQHLGHHTMMFRIPDRYILGIILAVFAGLVVNRFEAKGIGKRRYLIWIISSVTVLAAVFLGCMLRFTPIGGADRVQISFRYYLPIVALGLVMTGTDKKENRATLYCLFFQNIWFTGAICYILYHLITI